MKLRRYEVLKVRLPNGEIVHLVVSEDLEDPDVFAVIERFKDAVDAWRYIDQVTKRNVLLAREAGCAA